MERRTITPYDEADARQAPAIFFLAFFGIWFVVGLILTVGLLLSFPGWSKLAALFPLVFAVIGAGGLWYATRVRGKSPKRILAFGPTARGAMQVTADLPLPKLKTFTGRDLPVRLSLDHGAKGSVGVLLFINLFWNGIVGVFVGVALFTDEFPWFIWFFLSPFILVGGFLILALINKILVATRIPATVVEINHEPACPGETVRVSLSQEGSFYLEELTVELICEEKISYTRGTDTYREERTVWSEYLAHERGVRVEGGRPWRKSVEFQVPVTAMHSFDAEHNQIAWRIVVKGGVRKWPDYEYSFPFRVMPNGAREMMSWNRQSLSA
jgi:hypothetical protein